MYSHAGQVKRRQRSAYQKEIKCNMWILFQGQNIMFFPMVHLFNILCAGKWIKLFTKTVFEFNLHFQHIGLTLQENQVHHSKERKLLV
jgi:hypothetical protein